MDDEAELKAINRVTEIIPRLPKQFEHFMAMLTGCALTCLLSKQHDVDLKFKTKFLLQHFEVAFEEARKETQELLLRIETDGSRRPTPLK